MDLSLLGDAIRLVMAAEYAFAAVAGAAAAVHVVAMDAELRKHAREQKQMLDGFREAMEAKAAERESKRRARLAAAIAAEIGGA
ncbi:MAG: hypothetical protein ACNS63_08175 [Candidatus Nitrospinota bacterium M3_3B_026]